MRASTSVITAAHEVVPAGGRDAPRDGQRCERPRRRRPSSRTSGSLVTPANATAWSRASASARTLRRERARRGLRRSWAASRGSSGASVSSSVGHRCQAHPRRARRSASIRAVTVAQSGSQPRPGAIRRCGWSDSVSRVTTASSASARCDGGGRRRTRRRRPVGAVSRRVSIASGTSAVTGPSVVRTAVRGAWGRRRRGRRSSTAGRTIASGADLRGHRDGRLVGAARRRSPQQSRRRRSPGTPVCAARSSASWTRSGVVGVRRRGDVRVGPRQRQHVVARSSAVRSAAQACVRGVPADADASSAGSTATPICGATRAPPQLVAAARPPGQLVEPGDGGRARAGPPRGCRRRADHRYRAPESGRPRTSVVGSQSRNVRWMPTRVVPSSASTDEPARTPDVSAPLSEVGRRPAARRPARPRTLRRAGSGASTGVRRRGLVRPGPCSPTTSTPPGRRGC